MITRPMLAHKIHEISEVPYYPMLATPKIDGIRCLKINGKAITRSFKSIPNDYTRELIEAECPDGIDGELVVSDGNFNSCQSAFMRKSGKPNFIYMVFDYAPRHLDDSYWDRVQILRALQVPVFVTKLIPELIRTAIDLKTYEDTCLTSGYEGVMLRTLGSPYKCGRSTPTEGYLIALKRFKRREAIVVGFEPRMHNLNEAEKDNFGNTKRASHKNNKIALDTLGVIIAVDCNSGKFKGRQIRLGTGQGLTDAVRGEIWNNQLEYVGKTLTYQYQAHGSKDLPRIPSFIGFRSLLDL